MLPVVDFFFLLIAAEDLSLPLRLAVPPPLMEVAGFVEVAADDDDEEDV